MLEEARGFWNAVERRRPRDWGGDGRDIVGEVGFRCTVLVVPGDRVVELSVGISCAPRLRCTSDEDDEVGGYREVTEIETVEDDVGKTVDLCCN